MRQLIAPNPNIPCQPGWCLAYVNEAFGVKKVFPSATSAWFGSKTKHTGRDFPPGVWVPVWYGLDSTPLGHVVLLAPDGSVYSTSDLTNTPHHHPSLADLEAYYAYYGMTLTYRGWTEDVEGTPVIARESGGAAIGAQSESITEIKEWYDMPIGKEDLLAIAAAVNNEEMREKIAGAAAYKVLNAPILSTDKKKWPLSAHIQGNTARTVEALGRIAALAELVGQVAKAQGTVIDYSKVEAAASAGAAKAFAEAQDIDAAAIADAVVDEQASRLAK